MNASHNYRKNYQQQHQVNSYENLNSMIYRGTVRHIRHDRPDMQSKKHKFSYDVFMMYLDLDELDLVFSKSIFWSRKNKALAQFKEQDYFFDAKKASIKETVKQFIFDETHITFEGRICVLTNLRYFGYLINPITCYYCFDRDDVLKYLVAEVTNTPWKEIKRYLIPVTIIDQKYSYNFAKNMHVSPFMPMDLLYRWQGNLPDKKLNINLQCHTSTGDYSADYAKPCALQKSDSSTLVFAANLSLSAHKITRRSLNGALIQYPFMTVKIFIGIHWQAVKLFLKKIPIIRHPKHKELF